MKILTLFFTYGTSLKDWDKNGTLDREINIYGKFLGYFDKVYFITYGSDDFKYIGKLPSNIIVLPKKWNVNNIFYSLLIPFAYKKEVRESSWLKTNQMMGSWSAVLTKLFFKKKLAVRTGYTESLFGRIGFRKFLINIIERIAYKSADISIITTPEQASYLEKKYSPKNIYVIPNGIDTGLFKPILNKIASPKIRLFFVGRLHPEKNLLNLLEAIKDFKDIELRIVGKGPLEKNMLRLKNRYKLDMEITSGVKNNKLPEMYNSADIYIQPSLYEGNPKTILEAMSCGIPVIATDIYGINNVITHGENGYLCKTDSNSIKEAIEDLKNNTYLRTSISSKAVEFIEKNYNLDKTTAKELGLYK